MTVSRTLHGMKNYKDSWKVSTLSPFLSKYSHIALEQVTEPLTALLEVFSDQQLQAVQNLCHCVKGGQTETMCLF